MVARAFRLSILVVVAAYLALWGRQSDRIADDPGLGWHFRTGTLVLEAGSVPRTDPFLAPHLYAGSDGNSPRPWVADQWLSDAILEALYSFGGWPLVYAVAIGLFTVTFWGVVVRTAYVASGSALCAIIATAFAWKAAQVHFIIRPVLVSVLLFAVVAARTRSWAVEPLLAQKKRLREVFLLCCLFVVWASAHPAFVLGLLLLAVLAVVYLVRYVSTNDRGQLKDCGAVIALFTASVGATLINPYGWRIYTSFLGLSRSDYLRSLNQEWRPLQLGSNEMLLLVIVAVLPLAAALVGKGYRARGVLFDCLVAILFTYGAFRMARVVPYAAIVSAPLAACALARLGRVELPKVLRATGRFISGLDKQLKLPSSPAVMAGVIAIAGIVLAAVGFTPRSATTMGPSSEVYPPRVFEVIKGDRDSGVILASPDYGGAIAWRLHPRFHSVLDDRNDLVGEGLYRRYFRALQDRTELEGIIRDYGVTHLIIANTDPVVGQLSEEQNWMILYQDTTRRVYRVRSN